MDEQAPRGHGPGRSASAPNGRLRLRRRPRLAGISSAAPLAGIVRDVTSARQALALSATRLERAGASYPAAYARSACGNADRAIEALCVISERERASRTGIGGPEFENLTTLQGRGTGILIRVRGGGGVSDRLRRDASGGFTEDPDAEVPIPVLEVPDLGWDLLRSDAAKALAVGDAAAGLLVRALSRVAWLHVRSKVRWSASRDCAALLARMLRDGRSAPDFADGVGTAAVDARVEDLVASLGWRRHNPTDRFATDGTAEATLH